MTRTTTLALGVTLALEACKPPADLASDGSGESDGPDLSISIYSPDL